MADSWPGLALALLPVAGAVVVAVVPRWAESRERRRTRYAEAVRALVAWAEFPYRVARRVSDESEVLAALAAEGHVLQQNLAFYEAWVSAESEAVGRLYRAASDAVRAVIGPALQAAWRGSPVENAADMNLGALGIDRDALRELLTRIAVASQTRFGLRRAFGPLARRGAGVFTGPVVPPRQLVEAGDSAPSAE